VSRVRVFTLLGGLTGLASAWILTAWTSLKWSLIVGGKDPMLVPVSPPYVVIMFEMMILFGGIATLAGVVAEAGASGVLSLSGAVSCMVCKERSVSCWYSAVPSVFQVISSSVNSRMMRAGMPATSMRGGTIISAFTNASAATTSPARAAARWRSSSRSRPPVA
jgi:hypothetical protein